MFGCNFLCRVLLRHHSLVPLPCILDIKHIIDYFQLLLWFLRLNVINRGTCFGNKPSWRVCFLVALVNCLENWILMLFVLRNIFFSVFWKQVIDFYVWLTFLSDAWEVLLSVLLRHYIGLQVIDDQVSDTFSSMWFWFIRWWPLIFDFPKAHIR